MQSVTMGLQANGESRIPRLSPSGLRRSSSLRVRGERARNAYEGCSHHKIHHQELFPAITENCVDTPKRSHSSLSLTPSRGPSRPRASPSHQQEEWSDADSVKSFGSNFSTASACDHASFALNGTTWSGRSQRYIVHCSGQASETDEYLTPTQRAARQVRKFQNLLREARKEIEEKEHHIFRLTKELVELRLYKASLNSPDEKTDSSDGATVRENVSLESPAVQEQDGPSDQQPQSSPSLVDSGHFDDGAGSSGSTLVVTAAATQTPPVPETSLDASFLSVSDFRDSSLLVDERRAVVDHYEGRIEEMHRRHLDEIQLLKQAHCDKVESLLQQLTEVNQRYYEARPQLDAAEATVKELHGQLEALQKELSEQKTLLQEQEERNKQMYLHMYSKGQEAARIEHADQVLEQAQKNPTRVTVAELLQQLTVTQAELENVKAMYRRIIELKNSQGALDPEITLQFLKSAIYYFLTDKDNIHGHLNAIESILGFTDSEKSNIDRIYRSAKK